MCFIAHTAHGNEFLCVFQMRVEGDKRIEQKKGDDNLWGIGVVVVCVFVMHILPFVIYRLWRLIGFHATDVDYHLNTVGIKLFYM